MMGVLDEMHEQQLKTNAAYREHYDAQHLIHRVAARVFEYRREAGLTQAKLAALTGTDQSYVARLESGDQKLTLQTLSRFARALDKDPSALVEPVRLGSIEDRSG